ncbi:MAG: hypothetical protein IJY65_05390 [Clostridia bacterium]|nr:hypothetical protein [Clostridia bacterium]
MNMFEEATALFGTIRMCKTTQEELAARLGMSQSYIANKLRLLRFSPYMRELILDANLSERHARALLRLEDEPSQRAALSKIRAGSLNVAESEAMIEEMVAMATPKRLTTASPADKIERICDMIDSSVFALNSCGVSAEKRLRREGGRLMITLTIEEPQYTSA